MAKKKSDPNFPDLKPDEKAERLGWIEDLIDDDEPTVAALIRTLTQLENNKGPVLFDLSMSDCMYRIVKKTKADLKQEARIRDKEYKNRVKALKKEAASLGFDVTEVF